MLYLLLALALAACAVLGAKCYFSQRALNALTRDVEDIWHSGASGKSLRLSVPDASVEKLASAINGLLSQMDHTRQADEKREREFRKQIEAVSHDLRTPLTVILGYLALLAQNNALAPEDREMLASITTKAHNLEKLVATFYEYSLAISPELALTPARIDAGKILRETFLEHYLLLENRQLTVEPQLADRPFWVIANADALTRILVNLMQNAARYAKSTVRISIDADERETRIAFANDSDQLAPEALAQIFDRFYMTDATRSQGGSGLGLTIAKSLAEKMDADLVASWHEPDTVCFTLTMKNA